MIDLSLSIELPCPWNGEVFNTDQVGSINFLVGPNGSGKSQFSLALHDKLSGSGRISRLLGTDRLRGMEQSRSIERFIGDHFNEGYKKREFRYYKEAGSQGAGIDSIMLLEERMDLRIQVEATLSQLFERELLLEWDSGNLMPRMRRRDGSSSYRFDREECHGIKELLVLLTHLYNSDYAYLIVDEPELNLHPQYQAFYMSEVRTVAGDPTTDNKKKIVFLVTHSPYIVDVRSEDDLRSIISFDSAYGVPRHISGGAKDITKDAHFLSRLNAHHKQFFFSDNPIFVEGASDAHLVTAILEASGRSVSAAGSCVIDAGGAEEVNQYVKLCNEFGKIAYYIFDLDSLFSGNLRSCIKRDETIRSFLRSAGLGNDVAKYIGLLDQEINGLIDRVLARDLPVSIDRLRAYLSGLGFNTDGSKGNYGKARTAVMVSVSRYRSDMESIAHDTVADVEGRLAQIIAALAKKNIYVLSGGTIERYLPSYRGDDYELTERAKHAAVAAEIDILSKEVTELDLVSRYGELYSVVTKLPTKRAVDVDSVLRSYLGYYIHELQNTVKNNRDWQFDEIQARLKAVLPSESTVFSVRSLERKGGVKFKAIIGIVEMTGNGLRATVVSERTNAGMGEFEIVSADQLV